MGERGLISFELDGGIEESTNEVQEHDLPLRNAVLQKDLDCFDDTSSGSELAPREKAKRVDGELMTGRTVELQCRERRAKSEPSGRAGDNDGPGYPPEAWLECKEKRQ
jgi:hypothetical protein